MPMPNIEGMDRKKPLCYDPERRRFIYFDDIISGRERIIPVDRLSENDLKRLVIKRHKTGPNYTVRAMSGNALSRDDVVNAIEKGESFGRMTLEAEASALRDLLAEIERNLHS